MTMKANKSECESVEEIMSRVPQTLLVSHYMNITSLPMLINSPLRNDTHPSFFIYSPDGIKVLYKDYATGDKGDIYSLLQKYFNISFSQLIRKIASEKTFENNLLIKQYTSGLEHKRKTTTTLKVKIREWRSYDIKYWESYGITLKWLKFAEVFPISHKILYKEGQRYVFHAAKQAYVFVERKEGNVSLKVYQPFSKRFKWHTSNDGSVVGLWTKIPATGDKLVICSSLKDALCFWSNIGIPAIYVQSETTGLSYTAQEELKRRYKEIFICFDNDAPGIKDAEVLSSNTGYKNVVLPLFAEGKDISDLYKVKGKEEFIRIVKPLFNGK